MFEWWMMDRRLFNAVDGGAGAGADAGGGHQQQQPQGGGQTSQDGGQQGQPEPGQGLRSLIGQQQEGAGQGQPRGQQQQQPQGQPYYPDGLPETYRGKSDRETIDALVKGLRQPPATPADYKLELAPEVAKALPNLDKDPAFQIAAKIAHKNGLDNAQLSSFVGELYLELAKEGILEPAIDTDAEVAKLEPREANPTRRQAAAAARMNAAEAWIKGMRANGTLTADEASVLAAGMTIAAGTTLVEKFMALAAKGGVTVEGGQALNGGAQHLTPHEKAVRAMYPSHFKS